MNGTPRDVRGVAESIARDLRAFGEQVSAGGELELQMRRVETVLMLRAAAALLDAAAKQPCRCDCKACRGHRP